MMDYQLAKVSDIEANAAIPQNSSKNDLSALNFSEKAARDLRWTNIDFKVGEKKILDGCWGHVPAGKVCAIMGPSGAGKSSLLNVLAGRSSSAPGIDIAGTVKVGETFINPVSFRQNIAYVMQDDALMATSTPREALRFSASLRLDSSVSSERIDEIVDAMLNQLGIQDCADVMIGGAMIKGISGGQRKRTSVGAEIITDPALLFLDEPTSGLDSFSAFNLITLLKGMASSNCSILCTIHQPSSEVFFLFDLVIFMKAGKIFYQGPVTDIVKHFGTGGYNCPDNYNPSDYVMYLCQTEPDENMYEKDLFMSKAPDRLGMGDVSVKKFSSTEESTIKATFFKQLQWLAHREMLNVKRDVGALFGRFGITIFLNLLFGLIFFGAGSRDDSDPTNFQSHFGAVTMVTISSMFGSATPIMLAFPFERPMFMREYSTGTYSAAAYFMSKAASELPLNFLQCCAQYILVYFLVGFNGSWIFMVLCSWSLGLASGSMAVLLGCAVPDVKTVTELSPLLFVPQLLFAGFFIKTSQIPVFLRWAQYVCSLKYCMNLVLLIEFDENNGSCKGAAAENCKAVLERNDIKKDQWYVYLILLAILIVGTRLIAARLLAAKAKRFY